MDGRSLELPGHEPKNNHNNMAEILKNKAETNTAGGAFGSDKGYQNFIFRGKAGEYFGIWIVCILLSAVTFGVYSAWAKVRRNRYFYGNTILAGHGFDYHATGGQIFKGRLIVFFGVIFFGILSELHPALALINIIILMVLSPYFIARGLRFNARVTSYRNVRFDFTGTYGGAFLAFIVGPILAALSLSILAPVASKWLRCYVLDNLRYGSKAFATSVATSMLYWAWLKCVFLSFACVVVMVIATAAVYYAEVPALYGVSHILVVVGYIYFLTLFVVYKIDVRNIVISATVFAEKHKMMSNMKARQYIWITVSNILVTLLTLGFMRPWAAVRMAKYTCDHTAIRFVGDIENLYRDIEQEGSAIGSEYIDFEGIDLGF